MLADAEIILGTSWYEIRICFGMLVRVGRVVLKFPEGKVAYFRPEQVPRTQLKVTLASEAVCWAL